MNLVDNYLCCIEEGAKWDATKKFLGKHKGKIMAGAAAVAVGSKLASNYYKHKKANDKVEYTPNRDYTKPPVSPIYDLQKHVAKVKAQNSKSPTPSYKNTTSEKSSEKPINKKINKVFEPEKIEKDNVFEPEKNKKKTLFDEPTKSNSVLDEPERSNSILDGPSKNGKKSLLDSLYYGV